MNLGQKLNYIRKSNNLSQEDMADLLFTTQGNYSQYENNLRNPSIGQLKILVDRFNIDANCPFSNNDKIYYK